MIQVITFMLILFIYMVISNLFTFMITNLFTFMVITNLFIFMVITNLFLMFFGHLQRMECVGQYRSASGEKTA